MPNGVLSPAASAGTQRPRRQVCSLPEEAAVGGREAQALHEVLPSRLLQRVSWLGARRGGREGLLLRWVGRESSTHREEVGWARPLGRSQSGSERPPRPRCTPPALPSSRWAPAGLVADAGLMGLCVCCRACQKTHWPDHKALCRPENIGFPFLISVPESRLTYARLAQLLEGYAR